jgi:hypothetical protein
MLEQAQDRGASCCAQLKEKPSFGFRGPQGQGCYGHAASELCGHKSKATTEKYSKARWRETAALNQLKIRSVHLCPISLSGALREEARTRTYWTPSPPMLSIHAASQPI